MADTITVKELADKAGTGARTLRRFLRSKFTRADKGKAYEWKPGDPQAEAILKAWADGKNPKPAPVKPHPEKAQPSALLLARRNSAGQIGLRRKGGRMSQREGLHPLSTIIIAPVP